MPVEDPGPEANTLQTSTLGPNIPPQVETVVNRFKLWRTGTILPVCFLNGDRDLRAFFITAAHTWLDRGGIMMDFGNEPAYRNCGGPEVKAIRVAFGYRRDAAGWDTGNWSYVGTDANIGPAGPTLNIGYAANTTLNQLEPRELRRLIWHELGHALGLEHEHQSPLEPCEFNWTKVEPYFEQHYGWKGDKTRFNLGRLKPVPGLQASAFDPGSIMNYSFPAWMFLQPATGTCEIKENSEPSQTDLANYAVLYPGRQLAQATSATAISQPSLPEQEQRTREVQEAQQQQDRAVVERAARAVAALQVLLPDQSQQRQVADLISSTAQLQFQNFAMNVQGNTVTVGRITQSTSGNCSPAISGVGGNATVNPSCTTTNNNIGTQNNIQGNQFNNPSNVNQFINNGTANIQGGVNFGISPK